MKISKFQFEDKSLEWRLEELQLNKLTLLVGASGVGKTQILRSLMGLKEITEGTSINGAAWFIEFETLGKQKYIWQGEFENKGVSIFLDREGDDEEDKKNKPKIIFEKLFLNDKLIVNRTSDKILFNGQPTIRLSQQESVLNLLKEEELVKPAHEGFTKLDFTFLGSNENDVHKDVKKGFSFNQLEKEKLLKKYLNINRIQESSLHISFKLFLTSLVEKDIFKKIKQRFITIFPQVEDLKIAPYEMEKKMPDWFNEYHIIQVKEKGIKNWIPSSRLSSGMLRTLLEISELYLCAEGAIFLIDEFENSLGINCINEITNDILASRRQLQFILTSHHPYIINAIGFQNWKLVTRNAGIVKIHNIDKFGIGDKSKHSAFMQLIQLEEYQTGQEQ